jgi:hypothetical protein
MISSKNSYGFSSSRSYDLSDVVEPETILLLTLLMRVSRKYRSGPVKGSDSVLFDKLLQKRVHFCSVFLEYAFSIVFRPNGAFCVAL